MFNEQFRIYRVVIFNTDGTARQLEKRTRDEAQSALVHYIGSWTTRSITVINTDSWQSKSWKATPERRRKSKQMLRNDED